MLPPDGVLLLSTVSTEDTIALISDDDVAPAAAVEVDSLWTTCWE